ncbi:MAG TPA: hypothetical protein VE954_24755 [Oligoflexus sp.]|uniref:hypothetical protein n=1 Tax=Oligoflexus sp. TaxID=1971216 RepID=UPI002D2ACB8A|nr:hypothetical protein [Oligoflexus sp.]HYX36328.1 hypothetical protein [Oligoflexus sp.]
MEQRRKVHYAAVLILMTSWIRASAEEVSMAANCTAVETELAGESLLAESRLWLIKQLGSSQDLLASVIETNNKAAAVCSQKTTQTASQTEIVTASSSALIDSRVRVQTVKDEWSNCCRIRGGPVKCDAEKKALDGALAEYASLRSDERAAVERLNILKQDQFSSCAEADAKAVANAAHIANLTKTVKDTSKEIADLDDELIGNSNTISTAGPSTAMSQGTCPKPELRGFSFGPIKFGVFSDGFYYTGLPAYEESVLSNQISPSAQSQLKSLIGVKVESNFLLIPPLKPTLKLSDLKLTLAQAKVNANQDIRALALELRGDSVLTNERRRFLLSGIKEILENQGFAFATDVDDAAFEDAWFQAWVNLRKQAMGQLSYRLSINSNELAQALQEYQLAQPAWHVEKPFLAGLEVAVLSGSDLFVEASVKLRPGAQEADLLVGVTADGLEVLSEPGGPILLPIGVKARLLFNRLGLILHEALPVALCVEVKGEALQSCP